MKRATASPSYAAQASHGRKTMDSEENAMEVVGIKGYDIGDIDNINPASDTMYLRYSRIV